MVLTQKEDTVNINNELKLSVDQFRVLEPTFPSLPTGYTHRVYEKGVRHEISGPNLPVIKESLNWDDGDRYLRRLQDFENLYNYELQTAENEDDFSEIVQNELRKLLPYAEARKLEYPSTEELIVALWELCVENRSESTQKIQALRVAIKDKYPKPE